MLIFIFGLPGSGKNYIGNVFQEEFNFYFHDADIDLTPQFKKFITNGEIASEQTRDEYYNLLTDRIEKLHNEHELLVVSDVLHKEKHRVQLHTHFPKAIFILLTCEPHIIDFRLEKREHLISKEYALRFRTLFEPPRIKHIVFLNDINGKTDIVKQIKQLLA